MPPEGHVFLTIIVREPDGTGVLPDCVVELEPIFDSPPGPEPATGISNEEGVVELTQPHGNYELFTSCPGREIADPVLVELKNTTATYSRYEVAGGLSLSTP